MDSTQALSVLIAHINACNKPVNIDWNETQKWQNDVLERFVDEGLLVKGVDAQSLECTGCEHRCFMNVHLVTGGETRAFIVCDQPEIQSQMGRIRVPLERLQQWETSPKHITAVICRLLGFKSKPKYQESANSYRLEMLQGKKGRRWVSVQTQPLSLEINRHTVPMEDLLYFDGKELVIDKPQVTEILNKPPANKSKTYTPDISKREAGKLATQARHQDWKDEYLRLKEKHPQKSDEWISIQIAKLPVAQERDSNPYS